ncbi:MAG: hypothetical protein HZA53_14285 [Planctomycetes bacterium]|nr:hypothetical protein [Planctomycetota bacterium]
MKRPRLTAVPLGLVLLTLSSMERSAAQGRTSIASITPTGVAGNGVCWGASISSDGRSVAFTSEASDLVTGPGGAGANLFLRDMLTGSVRQLDVSTTGGAPDGTAQGVGISADGLHVAFGSTAFNLVPNDNNGHAPDTFLCDVQSGAIVRTSVGSNGSGGFGSSYVGGISGDGRFVAFTSTVSSFAAADTNGREDAFVRDVVLGTTELVSVAAGGTSGNSYSLASSISTDGRFVAFESGATDLVPNDTNAINDVFVRDRLLGTTVRVSVGPLGVQGIGGSAGGWLSADGSRAGFFSFATNLVTGGTFGQHVFVHELATGITTLVDVNSQGLQGNAPGGTCSLSSDGRIIAFMSQSTDLVANDTNGWGDAFVRDMNSGTTTRVSTATTGAQGNADVLDVVLSSDGRSIAFRTGASTLFGGDSNGAYDVFVHDRFAVGPEAFCFGDGVLSPCPCGNSGATGHGCASSLVAAGALLATSGSTAPDTLQLLGSSRPNTASVVYLQSTDVAASPYVFGDGLRCVDGNIRRLRATVCTAGACSVPLFSDPLLSVMSHTPVGSGIVANYQLYYRNASASFCPPATFNASNAVRVVW